MKKNIILVLTVVAALIGGAVGKTVVKSMFDRKASVSYDQVLVETSKRINATLPMHVDKETRMDSTVAGPGNRLTYLYTLVNLSSDDLDSATFIKNMRPQLIQGYRTSPSMAAFRERQVELHYHYRDKNGNVVAAIVVSPKDF